MKAENFPQPTSQPLYHFKHLSGAPSHFTFFSTHVPKVIMEAIVHGKRFGSPGQTRTDTEWILSPLPAS